MHIAVRPRAHRPAEAALIPRALEIFDSAYCSGELSLATLQRVHAVVADIPAGIGGRLRDGAAVVRLDGLPWLVAPPAAAARRDTEILVAALSARLAEHPPVSASMLAADALAILTDLHPFPDGNGRVARALATWLLVRAGYRLKPELTLDEFFRPRQQDCFRALRYHESDPLTWHRFFQSAVSETFILPPVETP